MGSIKWDRSRPGVVSLSNTAPAAPSSPQFRQWAGQDSLGTQLDSADRDILEAAISRQASSSVEDDARRQAYADEARFYNAPQPSKSDKRQWKKEIKQFDRYLREDGGHVEDGFDSLLQSGAVWADPDNKGDWSTSVPLTQRQLKSIADGFKQWQQQVYEGDPYYMESWQKAQDKYRDLYR